ncbi:MAG: HAD family phosphatase [Bacteroidales bacterium]|nr:HAD family phosphatase [Bacteroidales bacterium]NLK82168.1 HAD family phosphatase [Bacteroidales bacterium]HPY82317.1 HAD family phosphatase [Bacteroidales bacterium]
MMKTVENIIFDFGGVILNLDEQATFSQLQLLMGKSASDIPKIMELSRFYDFECGKITEHEFIENLLALSNNPFSKQDFISAWNAMLLDFPQKHVNLLLSLKTHFRTFLLSNTNVIHIEAFEKNMKQQGITFSMSDLFEEVWYSSSIGMRKPNPETYRAVTQKVNIIPERTLFLDDKQENLNGAAQIGLQTMLVTPTNSICSIFKSFL